jgi:predicted aminopeptidase
MDDSSLKLLVVVAIFATMVTVPVACYGRPQYSVYSQRMEGEAELAKAEYSKRVMVQDALARQESAKSLAEAEVIRAEGVARANKIIGDSLKDNESYLRYLWIHSLQEGKSEVIYVPTEANLPILESTRNLKK